MRQKSTCAHLTYSKPVFNSVEGYFTNHTYTTAVSVPSPHRHVCVCVTVLHFELPHKLVSYVHNSTLLLSSMIWRPCGKYKDNFVLGLLQSPHMCVGLLGAQWSNTTYDYFYHMCKITEGTLGVSFAKSHFLLLKKCEQSLTLLSYHHFVAETYSNF